MGGCTNCGAKSGCDHRKGDMLAAVDRTLAALYPTRTWGEPDDAWSDALGPDDLGALAEELAEVLGAATFVRPGGDAEPCDFIYVLCLGRTPCIVQVRDHEVAVPAEWRELDTLDELYLRLVVSQRTRMAAVQQVGIDVSRTAAGWVVRERPRAGVYDAPLLPRMQKLVATLPAYDLLHVDFGEIAHAPEGYAPGAWRDLYAPAAHMSGPAIANYLFYPQPATMVATTFVAEERRSA
jgi:hypothetical protein